MRSSRYAHFTLATLSVSTPASATLTGTVRTLDPAVHDEVARRVIEVAEGIARAYGASASVNYGIQYPITFNHARQTAFAADVAREIVGSEHVDDNVMAIMGSEDFSFMLNACPGRICSSGTGDGEMCHHPDYKFNDAVIPHGSSFWVKLIEKAMPVG